MAPGQLIFRVDPVDQVLESIGLLLRLGILHQLDNAHVAFDLHNARICFRQLHTKQEVVAWLLVFGAGWRDLDFETGRGFEVLEVEGPYDVGEMAAILSGTRVRLELNSLVLARDSSVGSSDTLYLNDQLFVSCYMSDLTLLLERKVAWFVVVDDQDNSPAVSSIDSGASFQVKELDHELAVFVPLLIVDDLDGDNLLSVTLLESNGLIFLGNSLIIFTSLGGLVLGPDTDGLFCSCLVQDFDVDLSTSL